MNKEVRSCDLYLLEEKLDNLNYYESVLCSGLSNTINHMSYGGSTLYILQGRGICFIDELLDKLSLAYRYLDIEELFSLKQEQYSRVMVTLPFMDFDKIQDLKTNVVQFFHTYGTYRIAGMNDDTIVLEGDYDEGIMEKSISKSSLNKLNGLKIKPLGVPFKLIYLESLEVSEENKRNCIENNIRQLIQSDFYEDERGGWIKGSDFYRSFNNILRNNWEQMNKVSKYVLLQSIQNGSSFFYRREYNEALKTQINQHFEELERSGNLWRKVARLIKKSIVEEKPIDYERIDTVVSSIEKEELSLFERILKERVISEYV
ncbi:hypothetical protein R2R35_08770 [Anaerocolumna sp. AGMB13020]|uniref:hypothetical protein n=1 Tax=Anaerocolumna sp. AGMB13020 TaxID=3081750 RepID=UPI002954861F|nr:hypothetical protein [Anaerocolumna sp. AGMB13020]WOO38581.1 hypothetical protein R2R35_08770 [Anaerocolumna sp. AGMB13020]